MIYTTEDLPNVVKQIQEAVVVAGADLNEFEISALESSNAVRVRVYNVDRGGFSLKLFGTNDFKLFEKELSLWSAKNA